MIIMLYYNKLYIITIIIIILSWLCLLCYLLFLSYKLTLNVTIPEIKSLAYYLFTRNKNGLHIQYFFLSAYSLFIIMFVYCCHHLQYSSCIVTLINIILLSDSRSIYTAPQFYSYFFCKVVLCIYFTVEWWTDVSSVDAQMCLKHQTLGRTPSVCLDFRWQKTWSNTLLGKHLYNSVEGLVGLHQNPLVFALSISLTIVLQTKCSI